VCALKLTIPSTHDIGKSNADDSICNVIGFDFGSIKCLEGYWDNPDVTISSDLNLDPNPNCSLKAQGKEGVGLLDLAEIHLKDYTKMRY